MAISWLNNTISKAAAPQKSLIDILRKNLGGWEKARDTGKVHASDVTKPGFCPKQLALMKITGKKKKDMYVNTALRATFDVGNVTSDLLRENWLGDAAHGFWRCQTCDARSSSARSQSTAATTTRASGAIWNLNSLAKSTPSAAALMYAPIWTHRSCLSPRRRSSARPTLKLWQAR
jgi:hypothetical protein